MAEEGSDKESSSTVMQRYELSPENHESFSKPESDTNVYSYEEMLENFKKALECHGEIQPAIELIESQSRPSKIEILNERAMILYKMKRYEEAMIDYNTIIQDNPLHSVVYKNRAMVLEALGQYRQASLDYKKSIQIARKEAIFSHTPRGKSIYKFRTLKEDLEEIQKQIAMDISREDTKELKSQEEALQTLLILKIDVEMAQKVFKKHINLETFFRHFIAKLEEVFIGYKTILHEFTVYQGKGISKGIDLLEKMMPLLPPSNVLDSMSILKNVADLGSLIKMLKYIEITARKLTEAYRDQLLRLRTSEEEEMQAEKHRNTPPSAESLVKKDFSVAQNIAEYGVLKILEAFQSERIDFGQINLSVDEQFIQVVMESPPLEMSEKFSDHLGSYTFVNRFGQKWNLHDFYISPLVKTPEGFYYGNGQSDADTYGYRYASIIEAQRWRLIKDPSNRVARVSLNSTSPADNENSRLPSSGIDFQQFKIENLALSRQLTDMQSQFVQLEKQVSRLQEKQPHERNCFCS